MHAARADGGRRAGRARPRPAAAPCARWPRSCGPADSRSSRRCPSRTACATVDLRCRAFTASSSTGPSAANDKQVAHGGDRAAPRAPGAQRQGPDLPDGGPEGGRHGHGRGGDARRRVRLDPRGHRRPSSPAAPSAAIERYIAGPAAALRGGAGALRPRPRVLLGGARPPGRRRLPQVARRARVLRLLRREPLPHRHGDRARRARLAARPHRARSARASAMRRACSAPTAPTRCSTARRPRTGPSCRPASATTRSRSATATATSRSSRAWSSPAASRSS